MEIFWHCTVVSLLIFKFCRKSKQNDYFFFQVLSPCPCGCHERLKMGSVIAAEVRQAILQGTGLTCCAGIAHNKLLAKLVAGWRKPNMQTTLLPEDAESLLSGLQARDIPGIISEKVNIESVIIVR